MRPSSASLWPALREDRAARLLAARFNLSVLGLLYKTNLGYLPGDGFAPEFTRALRHQVRCHNQHRRAVVEFERLRRSDSGAGARFPRKCSKRTRRKLPNISK